MGHCSRCQKYYWFLSSKYCDKCKKIIEDTRRREVEQRKAQRNQEGFQNRTLTQEEYESLEPGLKKVYLIDSIQAEEAKSLKEAILSQPKSKIIEIYNQWAFSLYKKKLFYIIERGREKADELEKQVYEKEFTIIQSCKSMNEIRSIMNQLPHCQRYADPGSCIYVKRSYLYDGKENYSWPRIDTGDNESCTVLLSKEENLLYRAFQIFEYNTDDNWFMRFHPQWNEYCDRQYDQYIQKRTEEAEKEAEKLASFKQFLAADDNIAPVPVLENEKQDTVKSDEPGTRCPVLTVNKEPDPVKAEEEQETAKPDEPGVVSPATTDNRENNTEKKAKKPRILDMGDSMFSARWK